MRLTNIKDKEILRYEIQRKRTNRKKYKKLSQDLGFKDIKNLTNLSVKEGNIEALMRLAQSNVYAVTAELQKSEYTQFFSQKHKEKHDHFIPELFFMIRSHAPKSFKIMLQRLTRAIILRSSLNISGRGSIGKSRHRIQYFPGIAEFDLNQTLFNFIQNGNKFLNMTDIVGIERRQKKRNVVLILDSSGSMFGKLLLNAALTTSVLSYAMEKDNNSIVLFNSEAYVLKNIKKPIEISKLIDDILETEAVGFTNVFKGLEKGLKELNKMAGKKNKIGILITDGNYNRGDNPIFIARRFPKLHVINIPPEKQIEKQNRGRRVCQDIATAGRGIFIPVKKFSEIPRTLMNLLAKI